MKKEIIVCDKCKKEFEPKTSIYATVFINSNGFVNDRCDICIDCWHEIFDHPTEKGGASDINVGSKTEKGGVEGRMNSFTVIDNETGTYPDCEKIALSEEWAKHLIYCDIDTFAITEDGNLILLDDCGNCAFCPVDRFIVVFEKGGAEE